MRGTAVVMLGGGWGREAIDTRSGIRISRLIHRCGPEGGGGNKANSSYKGRQ